MYRVLNHPVTLPLTSRLRDPFLPRRSGRQLTYRTMRLTICALLLLSSFIATAQTTFGIRAGYGQSALRSGSTLDVATDQLEGVGAISAGILAEVPLTNFLSLRPGLEYTQRGTSIELTEEVRVLGIQLPVGARARTTFNYLEAPVLFQFNLPTESGVQPYALIGPSIGYAVKGRLRTSARALIDFTLTDTEVNLEAINYERWHVAAVGGLGIRTRLGETTQIFLEARYEHGLTQPYNIPLIRDGVGFQAFNIGAGVSFALR